MLLTDKFLSHNSPLAFWIPSLACLALHQSQLSINCVQSMGISLLLWIFPFVSPPISFLVTSASIPWNLREAAGYNLKSLAFGSAVYPVSHICFRSRNLNLKMCVITASYVYFSIFNFHPSKGRHQFAYASDRSVPEGEEV